ncbi:MAG: hypothetical protein ABSC37_11455 [Xanthobacteraceae bacterium]
MFNIPPGTPDIPAGKHPGFIDWADEPISGGQVAMMTRAILHLKRADFPDLYKDVDITALVLKGGITFDFKM